MSSTQFNLQNILDNALTDFFSASGSEEIRDICYNMSSFNYNYLNLGHNLVEQNFERQPVIEREEEEEEEETKSNSGDSLPDLIPLDNNIEQRAMDSTTQNQNPNQNQQITLWYQLIEDYNAQIHTYQQNIQSIINITETILPMFNNNNNNNNIRQQRNTNTTSSSSRQNLISQLRTLFRNNEYTSPYILEFENITPLFSSSQSQSQSQSQSTSLTSQEIQNATELFIHDSNISNTLLYNTCPITLEEFREGEPVMRISYCGHIFKAFELQRWFLRNTKCPSCRYDIRTGNNPRTMP
jgi:hypothetical protein